MLSDNNLAGSIPAGIGNLTKLQILYLWNNHLTGDIPSTLGNLTKLQYIGIHQNNLTGDLNWIGTPTSMIQLFYYSNPDLDCTLPASVGNSVNMTTLAGEVAGLFQTPCIPRCMGLFLLP